MQVFTPLITGVLTAGQCKLGVTTQSRIIGAVRGAHSYLWGTIIPVLFPYVPRNYDKIFGTPAIIYLQRKIRHMCRTSVLQGEKFLIRRT